MRRWRPAMPRFTTPVIIQQSQYGPPSETGTNRVVQGGHCRVLKAFDTTALLSNQLPTGVGAATNLAPPNDVQDWKAWWPSPPDTNTRTYEIPDPPTMPRPVVPDGVNPILWEAYSEVGTSVWNSRISAIYVMCEWVPHGGREKLSGQIELSVNMARVKLRPGIIRTANIRSGSWQVVRVSDDSVWKLEAIVPSYRRGEFEELHLERTER